MESIEVVPKALNGAGQLGWWDLAVKAAVPPGCLCGIDTSNCVCGQNQLARRVELNL
jgi:hypothetical protein